VTIDTGTLTDRAARAATWRFAYAFTEALARFGIGVLLARLLTPADFGIVGLALVVIGFARPFGDFGLASAIVQRRPLTDRHVRVAFTLSTLVGVSLAALLAIGAPAAAALMRDPRLTAVLRVLSLIFATTGISVVAGGLLRRRLEFRPLVLSDLVSYIAGYGLLAPALALRGAGVWSLVAAALVQTLLSASAIVVIGRHSMRPLLARAEARELLHYGVGSGAASWVSYLALNADNFIVGRTLGAASLGLYARAYTLMNLPFTYTASVLSGVLFPAFAQIQNDLVRLRRAFLAMTELTALVAGGSMGTLAVAAPHIVPALFGPRWVDVVPPLQILCGAGYFRALYHVGGVVAHSAGLVYGDLRRQAFYAALVIAGSYAGATYGLPGVALGVSVAIVAMFVATGQLALRITQVSWREYMRIQVAPVVIAIVTGACAFGARALLAGMQVRDGIVATGTLAAAAVPWSVGVLWKLGDRDLQSVRARLPLWCRRAIELVRELSVTNT
jgi:O-antigen/teichoic acid export membrane protein